MVKGGGAEEDLDHECSENPLTPSVHQRWSLNVEVEKTSCVLKDSPCLFLTAWPGVMNGSLCVWALPRAGRVHSDGTARSHWVTRVQPALVGAS